MASEKNSMSFFQVLPTCLILGFFIFPIPNIVLCRSATSLKGGKKSSHLEKINNFLMHPFAYWFADLSSKIETKTSGSSKSLKKWEASRISLLIWDARRRPCVSSLLGCFSYLQRQRRWRRLCPGERDRKEESFPPVFSSKSLWIMFATIFNYYCFSSFFSFYAYMEHVT